MVHKYNRIKDLPAKEQKPFREYLMGKTCPKIPNVPNHEQDAYYMQNYLDWIDRATTKPKSRKIICSCKTHENAIALSELITSKPHEKVGLCNPMHKGYAKIGWPDLISSNQKWMYIRIKNGVIVDAFFTGPELRKRTTHSFDNAVKLINEICK